MIHLIDKVKGNVKNGPKTSYFGLFLALAGVVSVFIPALGVSWSGAAGIIALGAILFLSPKKSKKDKAYK